MHLMQSFIDKRTHLLEPKKPSPLQTFHSIRGSKKQLEIKSITTPNSPRQQRGSSKGQSNEESFEQHLQGINVVLNDKQLLPKHRIILPKGIINFHASQSRANSNSKSAERKVRKAALSTEAREESLRRKMKVMEIIKNLDNEEGDKELSDLKDMSFLLKSRKFKQIEEENKLFQEKGKALVHKRITKTFDRNSLQTSQERVTNLQSRQREKQRGNQAEKSPLMSDLNTYLNQKDTTVNQFKGSAKRQPAMLVNLQNQKWKKPL